MSVTVNCRKCKYYFEYGYPCPLYPCRAIGGENDGLLSST